MHIHLKKGLTLTELLVASILIGIVMAGVVSYSFSIKQFQDSTNKSTVLAARVAAAMSFITKDASLAVGDATNPGILTYSSGNRRSICFRHDILGTPNDYADDNWVCYYKHNPADDLRRCPNPTPPPPPTNNGQCGGGSKSFFPLTVVDFYTVVNDGAGRLKYIEIILSAKHASGAINPITNPEYTLTTRINPLGLAR
jgi:prepilin-type N-terminal cleavage/methylation domain-containing protein